MLIFVKRMFQVTYTPHAIKTEIGVEYCFLGGRPSACLCVVYNFCFIVIFSQQDTPAGEVVVVEEEAAAVATEATETEVRLHKTLSLYLWHN